MLEFDLSILICWGSIIAVSIYSAICKYLDRNVTSPHINSGFNNKDDDEDFIHDPGMFYHPLNRHRN